MGTGSYSVSSSTGEYDPSVRDERLRSSGIDYSSMDSTEIFTKRILDDQMNPKNVDVRESRDSEEHPKSLAIILALDVTGSMGTIPTFLVREGLPKIMGKMIQMGISRLTGSLPRPMPKSDRDCRILCVPPWFSLERMIPDRLLK